ncbi:hypothetical protein MRB53_024947 [Persea americana]|uniref:Uncharacterized protein n=1 Tax=Persea americana TaxID=3435 RepID=A0ACC2LDV7_PERAE|nr:hypothetical protein MRB53_024947 [Persea americana]
MRKSMEDVWKEITHQDPNTTFSSILPQETPPLPPTQLPCQHGQELHHHRNAFAFVAGPSSFCEKRMPEPSDDLDHRRRKRLIKSRESADRSRAKKQVHIHELELKLNHLMKENAKLRREHQKTWLADQLHSRKKLCRSFTAPF